MECLRATQVEARVNTNIYVENDQVTKTTHSGPMGPKAQSINEIAQDCATDPMVVSLRDYMVKEYMKLFITEQINPVQLLHGMFASGFAYGVRVGIEMERQEMPEVRL